MIPLAFSCGVECSMFSVSKRQGIERREIRLNAFNRHTYNVSKRVSDLAQCLQ